jgi:hypothetical protein
MLMGILKSIGLWLLKVILGSFADGILRAEKEKSERQSDALRTQLESVESGKNLEVEIREAEAEVEEKVEVKLEANKEEDPLGFKTYNEGV